MLERKGWRRLLLDLLVRCISRDCAAMADAPITYLGPSQDDAFELPRWQDNSTSQSYYDYAQAQAGTGQQQRHNQAQTPSGPPPQPRYAAHSATPSGAGYEGGDGSLSRAGSMGSTSVRSRTMHDDIEKAYHSPPQQHHHIQSNPFYPPSVAYTAPGQQQQPQQPPPPPPPQQQQQQQQPIQPEYFSSPRRSYDAAHSQPATPAQAFGYPSKTASPMLDPPTPSSVTAVSHTHGVSAPPSPYQPMVGIEQRQRRSPGFKRVRDQRDLRPYVSQQPPGRRLDPHGTNTFLSVSLFLCLRCVPRG